MISIDGDMRAAAKHLSRLERRQIPFATSLALNKTAGEIQRFEKIMAKIELDRPTKTTVNAIRVKPSKKSDLEARIFIIPGVARFLRYQIEGGRRPVRGRVEAIPRDIKLNKFGNIAGRRTGKLRKLLSRPNTFQGTHRGVSGIWQRGKGKDKGLKLLVEYSVKPLVYRPRFRFYRHADRMAVRVWDRNFSRSLKRALASAV